MGRERWGTFSVKDHTLPQPFAADVLMYDRLVIPKPSTSEERKHWTDKEWDPDKLDVVLDLLGADKPDGRAVTVAWNKWTRELFNERATAAKIVNEEANLGLTKRLLAADLLPPAPPGVIRIAVVAAYNSAAEAAAEWVENEENTKRNTLTLALSHRFIVPEPRGRSDLQLLRDSLQLAKDPTYAGKRAQLYGWIDDVIEKGIETPAALDEMAQYLVEYEKAVKAAEGAVYTKFGFTLVPVALAALAGPIAPLVGAGLIANLIRFWIYDRKPVVQAGVNQPAAMFHANYEQLAWRQATPEELHVPQSTNRP